MPLAFLCPCRPDGPLVRIWRYDAETATEALYRIWVEPAPLHDRLLAMDSIPCPATKSYAADEWGDK